VKEVPGEKRQSSSNLQSKGRGKRGKGRVRGEKSVYIYWSFTLIGGKNRRVDEGRKRGLAAILIRRGRRAEGGSNVERRKEVESLA